MKNLFFLLATAIFFIGCSTNNNGTVTVIPLAPNNLTGTVISTTQVNLSWIDNATNEDGYKVERKTGNGNYAVIGSMGANLITYSDLGLTTNTTYTYRVYAYNSVGNSLQYSNELTLTTQDSIPTNGLMGYWPFNGNANDESGNGNNGVVNGATLTNDRFGNSGKAYSFDGVNDYIETPHSSTLLFSQNEVSISTWISVSNWPTLNQTEDYFLSKQSSLGSNQVGFHSYIFSGTTSSPVKAITNRYRNGLSSAWGAVSIINNNLGSGVWYNIIYTHYNDYDKIYIDGILVDSQNSVQLGGTNTAPLIFGCLNNYLMNFNGNLDDIRIYNRTLTQSEVTYLATH